MEPCIIRPYCAADGGARGAGQGRAEPREARFVISQDRHNDFVLFVFPLVNRQSLRQPVDGCGGARSRALQVRMCCSISCLVRHVSHKVFSFCMRVNRFFFFSLLAFTRSYCHPQHAIACSFGTLSQPNSARGFCCSVHGDWCAWCT